MTLELPINRVLISKTLEFDSVLSILLNLYPRLNSLHPLQLNAVNPATNYIGYQQDVQDLVVLAESEQTKLGQLLTAHSVGQPVFILSPWKDDSYSWAFFHKNADLYAQAQISFPGKSDYEIKLARARFKVDFYPAEAGLKDVTPSANALGA